MSPARLIVMAIVMMAAPAATPARAQEHHGAAPAAAAKAKPAPPPRTTATSALDAVARITKRLDEELPPVKPTGKAAGGVAPEAGIAPANPARSNAARGRRPAERPRVNLDWRLSVAWTEAADALSGRPPAEEEKVPAIVLEACANSLHVHLDAGVSPTRLMPPVLSRRPSR